MGIGEGGLPTPPSQSPFARKGHPWEHITARANSTRHANEVGEVGCARGHLWRGAQVLSGGVAARIEVGCACGSLWRGAQMRFGEFAARIEVGCARGSLWRGAQMRFGKFAARIEVGGTNINGENPVKVSTYTLCKLVSTLNLRVGFHVGPFGYTWKPISSKGIRGNLHIGFHV